jgi:hypothetical protein
LTFDQEVCKKKVLYTGSNFQAKAFRPPPPLPPYYMQYGIPIFTLSAFESVVMCRFSLSHWPEVEPPNATYNTKARRVNLHAITVTVFVATHMTNSALSSRASNWTMDGPFQTMAISRRNLLSTWSFVCMVVYRSFWGLGREGDLSGS